MKPVSLLRGGALAAFVIAILVLTYGHVQNPLLQEVVKGITTGSLGYLVFDALKLYRERLIVIDELIRSLAISNYVKTKDIMDQLYVKGTGHYALKRLDLKDRDLKEIKFIGFNFQGTNLVSADLSGADLSRADLSTAILGATVVNSANLTETRLSSSNLGQMQWDEATPPKFVRIQWVGNRIRDITLVGLDLSSQSLTEMTIENTTLIRLKAKGTNLNQSVMQRVDILNHPKSLLYQPKIKPSNQLQQMQGLQLVRATMSTVELRDADLSTADFRYSTWSDCEIYSCLLHDSKLDGLTMQNSAMSELSMKNVSLRKATIVGGTWRYGILINVDARGAKLEKIFMKEIDLSDVDLRGASLRGSFLEGAKLNPSKMNWRTKLPDGKRYHRGLDLEIYTNPNHDNFYKPQTPNRFAHLEQMLEQHLQDKETGE